MRLFHFLVRFLLLAIIVAGGLLFDAYRELHEPLAASTGTTIEIAPGDTLSGLLSQPGSKQWLPSARSALYLKLYVRWQGVGARIRSGEYALDERMNLLDALDRFLAGSVIVHELRIVEGWTFSQALDAIRANPMVRQTLGSATPDQIMTAIGQPGLHPEGRFFPDTYRFAKDTPDLSLLREAFAKMQKTLSAEWQQREAGLPYATPDEALTMASIIEKETGAAAERAQIAGVFVRRLRLGMRLQTDPTVIYGIGNSFSGNLRLIDLRTDGPYNTYLRSGLPPTPISLPGLASLHAALHPDDGKALFFVARGDGTHVFSETIEQHDAAVRRYQLKKSD
jgi:UPF0755 protein